MCNLYAITRSQEAMRRRFAIARDLTGNLPPLPSVFPDGMAPIVRVAEGERELTTMRWGMPGPSFTGGVPITNVRNTKSPHWRRWLGPERRCLVPVTSFCEYAPTKPRKTPTWFALDDTRPLFAFAGPWTTWSSTRSTKAEPVGSERSWTRNGQPVLLRAMVGLLSNTLKKEVQRREVVRVGEDGRKATWRPAASTNAR